MKYNNFWKLMGVSLICITVFGVSNANAKTTTMFTFTVDKPVNGQDACAPRVYNQQGTGEYADCYRIVSVPQIVGPNGTCIDDPNPDGASSASDWICPGAPGASCNIVSSEKSNGRSTINLKCGTDPVTTLEIDDGAAGQNGKDGKVCNTTVSRNASTGKTLITASCEGQTPQTAEIDEDAIATNTVNKIKDDNTVAMKDDISDFQTASDVNTLISNATTKEMLKQKLDSEYLTGIPNTVAMKDDLNGYVTTSGSGNNSIGKILEANNVITTSNIGNNIPGTVAMKDDLNGYVTQQNIGTAVDNAISENTNILQGGKNGQTLDQVIAEKVAAALTTAAASCSDEGAETVTCTSQVAQAFQALAGRSGVTTNKNTSD